MVLMFILTLQYKAELTKLLAKLTEKEVREICELIQSGKYFDTEIAKMYNIKYEIVKYKGL